MDYNCSRYAAEVDQLYPESGPKCTVCGLRFPEGNEAAKRRHLDWHFEQNKRENRRRPPARNWYFAAEDWVNFAESEQEVVQKGIFL